MNNMITQTILALTLLYVSYAINQRLSQSKTTDKHKYLMKEERSKQVYYFRDRMCNRFGAKVYEFMPSYSDMLNSSAPLIASVWVDVDRLSNTKSYKSIDKLVLNISLN